MPDEHDSREHRIRTLARRCAMCGKPWPLLAERCEACSGNRVVQATEATCRETCPELPSKTCQLPAGHKGLHSWKATEQDALMKQVEESDRLGGFHSASKESHSSLVEDPDFLALVNEPRTGREMRAYMDGMLNAEGRIDLLKVEDVARVAVEAERKCIERIIEADIERINGYEKASENGAWYDAGRVDVLTNLLAAIRQEGDDA